MSLNNPVEGAIVADPATPSGLPVEVDLGTETKLQPLGDGGERSTDVVGCALKKPTLFADERGNLRFVNASVRRPCAMLCAVLAACVFTTVLFIILAAEQGVDVFSESKEYDVKDIRSIRYISLKNAIGHVQDNRDKLAAGTDLPLSENGDYTYFVYEAEKGTGLLTSAGLRRMKDVEEICTAHPDYQDKYCLREYDETDNATWACTKPVSVLNMYYASNPNVTLVRSVVDRLAADGAVGSYNAIAFCVEYYYGCDALTAEQTAALSWGSTLSQDIDAIVDTWDGLGELTSEVALTTELAARMKELTTKKFSVDFFFDSKFSVDNQKTMFTRSIVLWGAPLEGYENEYDRQEDQEQEFEDWAMGRNADYGTGSKGLYDPLQKVTEENPGKVVSSYYFMGALIWPIFLEVLIADGLKAVASLLVVYVYVRIMVGSWFLATIGMIEIVMSIPCAMFFYKQVFRIEYFAGLNMLTIFIVAAIGADDIFVFMDAYRQSAFEPAATLVDFETRLSWVYRRSGYAMLTTSCTTCAAFLCTVGSPIPDVASFGIFAAFVIAMDYCLVMTLFCVSIVVYHDHFEGRQSNSPTPASTKDVWLKFCCFCRCCCNDTPCCCNKLPIEQRPTAKAFAAAQNKETKSQGLERVDAEEMKADLVTTFFKTRFTDLILNPKARAVVFVCYVAWMIPAIMFAAQLKPTERSQQFLDEDHPIQKAIAILNTEFPVATDDYGMRVHIAWGVSLVNVDDVNLLMAPEEVNGLQKWNGAFTFSEACQEAIIDVCDDLKTNADYTNVIKRSEEGFGIVNCLMYELRDWTNTSLGAASSFPLPESQKNEALAAFFATGTNYENDLVSEVYSNEFGWCAFQYRGRSPVGAELSPPASPRAQGW